MYVQIHDYFRFGLPQPHYVQLLRDPLDRAVSHYLFYATEDQLYTVRALHSQLHFAVHAHMNHFAHLVSMLSVTGAVQSAYTPYKYNDVFK